jgi:hypothetical protein
LASVVSLSAAVSPPAGTATCGAQAAIKSAIIRSKTSAHFCFAKLAHLVAFFIS